jgi:hypothetical protein
MYLLDFFVLRNFSFFFEDLPPEIGKGSVKMGSKVQVVPRGVSLEEFMANPKAAVDGADLTSADYYADSYSHFGIHGSLVYFHLSLTRKRKC